MPERLDIVVTVGMGRWPFDRLLEAIKPLCADHDVFAQTGTSSVVLQCAHQDFIPYPELHERMKQADVVITHAGNTVRLVQRMGKIPIAVARESARGEMSDDHQVDYLQEEERHGRADPIWDLTQLPDVVERFARQRLAGRTLELSPTAPAEVVADELDELWERLRMNPFRDHPLRRYAFAWDELTRRDYARRSGKHLDIGCNEGDFLATLAASGGREFLGVDVHRDYIATAQARYPGLVVEHLAIGAQLPFVDASFTSASLLDVLEHCLDDDAMLREVHRVLEPDGLLVLTVPARHLFSFLDPDNVKFRFPRLHRAVYTARFGRHAYRRRFVDMSDGLIGDIAVGRGEHTNYRVDDLVEVLSSHGFEVRNRSGANLFWRLFHGPSLLAGPRLKARLDRAITVDGRIFRSANLFLTLTKVVG